MSKNRPLRRDEVAEALLGDEAEITSPTGVDQFLSATGIDPNGIMSGFVEHLERRVAESTDPLRTKSLRAALALAKSQPSRASSPIPYPESDSAFWTNSSVRKFAADRNPVEIITKKCRDLIFRFSESGGTVVPLDPFALAEFVANIKLVPLEIVPDTRTRTVAGEHILEFNPNRPYSRMRYSVCHEIVHTLFPDCGEQTRNRATHEQMQGDDWQLEMLCNIGAGELLLPFDELPSELQERVPNVEDALVLRRKFHVSTEAVLLRLARVIQQPFCVFSASRQDSTHTYSIDYVRPSHNWKYRLHSGTHLPASSVVKNCTAIGHTDHSIEKWPERVGEVRVECVGISPYPGRHFPRVMGIISTPDPDLFTANKIHYVRGDASNPRLDGPGIIVHIVNDKTANWWGPFARALKQRWPAAQAAFTEWTRLAGSNLSLGSVNFTSVADDLMVATIVCQHGYGDSAKPRLRYGALQKGLEQVAHRAAEMSSSVHMPRIGSGEARGDWSIISSLIEEILCGASTVVTVYTLPNAEIKTNSQGSLFES